MPADVLARIALLCSGVAAGALALALLLSWVSLLPGVVHSPAGVHPRLARLRPAASLTRQVVGGTVWLAFAALTAAIAIQAVAAGRPPLASQYEFAVAFAWGTLGVSLFLRRRLGGYTAAPAVLLLALGCLVYASTLPSAIAPPVPALQNPLLLGLHVGCAVVAYGANAVAFAAGALFLVQSAVTARAGAPSRRLPPPRVLDEMGYSAVLVGFPMLGATLLLGSWWSAIAWGSWWSWDPKQSATLATWLLYAVYLHTRVGREWQGRASAALLVLGFAATLLTFAGNLFFGGMHGYAGV